VSGKIVVENGPLPRALLAFYTDKSYVDSPINPDGTFTLRLHSARHRVELAGMPGGYAVTSVVAGAQNRLSGDYCRQRGYIGHRDQCFGSPPPARMNGQITGLPNARLSSTKVEVTGPINGSLEAAVRPDGSFEFAALTPGMYRLRLPQVPELKPLNVVVSWKRHRSTSSRPDPLNRPHKKRQHGL
jgi:hypothetical protein